MKNNRFNVDHDFFSGEIDETIAMKPSSYLTGIKRLMQHNPAELKTALDRENEILRISV